MEKIKIFLFRISPDFLKNDLHPRGIRPPYVLKYIQSLLKKHKDFDVYFSDSYINHQTIDQVSQEVNKIKPDIIGVYLLSSDLYSLNNFIENTLKEVNCIYVVLGPGSLYLESSHLLRNKSNIIIMAGEAEKRFVELAKSYKKGDKNLKQFSSLEPLQVDDLNNLSFPSYSRQELKKYYFTYPLKVFKPLRWGHVLSSRGCPHNCIFCSPVMRESYGKTLRLRHPKNVVNEIIFQKKIGANIFAFDDDNFTSSREHVFKLCNEIMKNKINIPWITHGRVDDLDKDMLDIMKKAGCVMIRVGVESGSAKIISKLCKGNPDSWIERAKRVFSYSKKIGIGRIALFLIG
ncbi:radical SAM protein, partial [Candidatus Babeliales bacterium]|nr:radical SAM protein [Candidatus Babeliales bacterium]